MAYKLRQRQKMSTVLRYKLVVGGASILGMVAYMTIVMNTADVDESKAARRDLMANDPINNGEIVSGFSWDINPLTKADVGPNATSASVNAECVEGGTDSTFGLSAGNNMKDINMIIKPSEGLNSDGLDISIDFKRMEESGNFYTRGKTFNFGMKDGKLCIKYKLTAPNGKSYDVNETTSYEIPQDNQFRNYRFLYTPSTGKGEVMVDRTTIWTNQAVLQSRLSWKTGEDIIIGQGMNGGGKPVAIFDNLLVRKTGSSNNSPMELLSFTAEMQGNQIMLNWYTAKENGTDYYKIERSSDTKNYTEVGTVKAAGHSVDLKAYALLDTKPSLGVTYYRLGLTNNTAKSVWVPVIAFRVKPEMLNIAAPGTEPTSNPGNSPTSSIIQNNLGK